MRAARLLLGLLASAVVPTRAVQPGAARDVFIFHTSGYGDDVLAQYDWSVVSLVGVFGDPTDTDKYGDVLGTAHANGAQVVKATSYDLDQVTNASYRTEWVQDLLADALAKGYDGINIDKEGGTHDKEKQEAYVLLVQELATAFHAAINGSHISCDIPAYPDYEHWGYDYVGLAEAADGMFVMGYDNFQWDDYSCATRHDCTCANGPYRNLVAGIEEYIALGVDPAKLILGVPWYGIEYTRVAGVPFNEGHIDYGDVLALIDANADTGSVQWDGDAIAWRLACDGPCKGIDNDDSFLKVTEVWFDDAISLAPKYDIAPQYRLGGLGMWKSTSLDYTGKYPDETADMWAALAEAANAPARAQGSPPALRWYRSARDESEDAQGDPNVPRARERLSRRANVEWVTRADGAATDGNRTAITVDRTAVQQSVLGFGGAVTDASAHVFAQLHPRAQVEVLDLLWSDKGNRLSMMRVPMGATDFATEVYSYDDVEEDWNLDNFSVARDEDAGILPLIRAACRTAEAGGRDLRILATPWSAPGWMKRNGFVRNSLKPGLIQTNQTFEAWSDYFVRFIEEYQEAGVPVWAVTVQNEPHVAGQVVFTYPSMGFAGSDEGAFLGSFLGPRLKAEFPDLQVFVHDDQKQMDKGDTFMVDRVDELLEQPGAADYTDGVAFHWYGANLNNYDALQQLHADHPDLTLLATEATLKWPSARKWHEAVKYGIDIVNDLRNHAAGWIEWNVLLNAEGGPTCIGPMQSSSCAWLGNHTFGHCDAPLRAELDLHGHLHVGDQYYVLGHFSRFLSPGSTVVASSGASDQSAEALQWVAATTLEGGLVVVVLNTGDADADVELGFSDTDPDFADYVAHLTLPGNSISTLVLPATE